jgi:membrane protein implicated in regulation of membrane protease activity
MGIVSYLWIAWIVLILIFVIVEMITLDFVFLMIAAGSLGGLLSGLFGAPWGLQLLLAAVLSLLLLFFLRPPLLRALKRGGDPAKSNVDALIGMSGTVVATVSPTAGQVKLAVGETWTARLATLAPGSGAETAPAALVPGEHVIVVRIEGATAVVAPAPAPHGVGNPTERSAS